MARRKKSVVLEESAGFDPTSDRVAERAYEFYLTRGETHGHDLDDWLRAETELRAELDKDAAA